MYIGTDLCNPKRIEKVYKRFGRKFLQRILTESEIQELEVNKSRLTFIHRLAGRFAAKEALAKLFGTGIGKELSFQDLEIFKDPKNGSPQVKLSIKAQKLAISKNIKEIKVSISHEDTMVMAVAIAE
jgi:holo-[acyl-carrier protein] synthase